MSEEKKIAGCFYEELCMYGFEVCTAPNCGYYIWEFNKQKEREKELKQLDKSL